MRSRTTTKQQEKGKQKMKKYVELRSKLLCAGTVAGVCGFVMACGQAPDAEPNEQVGATQAAITSASRIMKPASAAVETASSASLASPVLNYHGGRVLSHVKVVPVFWGASVNATTVAQIPGFYRALATSSHLDWLSEYATNFAGGTNQLLGRGTATGSYTIKPYHTGSTLTDTDIQGELAQQLATQVLPRPTADSIYMVHFPPGITINSSSGTSCVQWCAYHGSFTYVQQDTAYAVVPDQTGCGCGTSTTFNNLSMAASHELVEAITDPVNAWWDSGSGYEIGDICNQQAAPLPDGAFTIQKEWSNIAKKCVTVGPQAGVAYVPGDFNGDGKTDLVITTATGSYWYFSNGNGTFSNPYTRADLPLGSVAYVPGDFNGDGKTDLVVTTVTGSYWYFSNGDGTFSNPYSRADLALGRVAYVPGDFNGDKKTDLVITTATGSYWYFSNGNGTFTTPYARGDLPLNSVAYVPGDFNGDGKTDLIVSTGTGAYWYFSNGDGTFANRYTRADLNTSTGATYTPGDFNGDGKTDIVITVNSGSYWYFSNGDGTWNTPYTRTDLPLGSVGYVSGDFNGDKKTDLIITTGSGSYWYFSNGDGTWRFPYTRTDLPLGNVAYAPGNFNGDAYTDLVITTFSGSYWYFSNGNGTWTFPYTRTDLPL